MLYSYGVVTSSGEGRWGGLPNWRGEGKRSFTPTVRFRHAKGGHKGFEVVLTRELEVLAIVMGGGGANSFALSRRGCKKLGTRDFPIL